MKEIEPYFIDGVVGKMTVIHLCDAVNELRKVVSQFEYQRDIEANTPQEPVDNKVDNKKTQVDDTHRTVTLRIPKGMRIGEAIQEAWYKAAAYSGSFLLDTSDTDLQKALDEVEHE